MQRVHVLERLLGMAEETERRLQHGLWACEHQRKIHITVLSHLGTYYKSKTFLTKKASNVDEEDGADSDRCFCNNT